QCGQMNEFGILHDSNINTLHTAGHAASLILSVVTNIPDFTDQLKTGNFSYRDGRYTGELKGKKLGIVGRGSIAQKVGKIMKYGFEMDVLAYVRRITEERQEVADAMGVELRTDMERVFKECEDDSVPIPLTEKSD